MQFEQKDPFLQLISKSWKLRSPGLDSHPTQRGQLRATTELFFAWPKGVGGDACHRSHLSNLRPADVREGRPGQAGRNPAPCSKIYLQSSVLLWTLGVRAPSLPAGLAMGMTLEMGSGRAQNPAASHRHILSRSIAALSPLLLAALLWVPAGTLTCIGDSGQPVDW